MKLHLAEIGMQAAEGVRVVMPCDGAGLHGRADIVVPDSIGLMPVPPCTPEPSPMENVGE